MKNSTLTALLLAGLAGVAWGHGGSPYAPKPTPETPSAPDNPSENGTPSTPSGPTPNTPGPNPSGPNLPSPNTGPSVPIVPGPPSTGGPAPSASPVTPLTGGPVQAAISTVVAPAFPLTGGSIPDAPEWTGWNVWWEFNKDAYLDLKRHVHAGDVLSGSDDFFLGFGERREGKDLLRPSERQIREKIVPALVDALAREDDFRIQVSSLIALARIGEAPSPSGRSYLEEVFKRHLAHGHPEVAEIAALSLGILGHDSSVDLLAELVNDSYDARRRLVQTTEVPYRMRAFSAYGLGLIGSATESEATRARIVDVLTRTLDDDDTATRDLGVACMVALGMVPLQTLDPPAGAGDLDDLPASTCRRSQLRYVRDFANRRSVEDLVRAHAPTTMVRLLRGLPAAPYEEAKEELVRDWLPIFRRGSGEDRFFIQSCVLAMGDLGDLDDDDLDRRIRGKLGQPSDNFTLAQARNFALISLGRMVGQPVDQLDVKNVERLERALLENLRRGNTQLRRWSAIACALLSRELEDRGQAISPDLVRSVREGLEDAKSPEDVGAYCIAAGLMRDEGAKDLVLAKLQRINDDQARGFAAVGLGLMNAREAVEPIQAIIRESRYRPELLRESAVALGLLGDKELVPELVDMLAESKSLAAQASISTALGMIGDSRSVDPLIWLLENDEVTGSARGFAAAALGLVADRSPLPWNAAISQGLNYRASTPTLLSGGSGRLGILELL